MLVNKQIIPGFQNQTQQLKPHGLSFVLGMIHD